AVLDGIVLGLPDQLAGLRVERVGVVIQRIEENLAVRIRDAAVYSVAAGDTTRGARRVRLEFPFDRAILRQVQRVNDVGPAGDDVHRVTDDDRHRFLAVQHAGREGPGQLQVLHLAGI